MVQLGLGVLGLTQSWPHNTAGHALFMAVRWEAWAGLALAARALMPIVPALNWRLTLQVSKLVWCDIIFGLFML